MPRRQSPPRDIDIREYRNRIIELGFAYLGGTADCYIDQRFPKAGAIKPVKNARGTILRRASIEACLAARAENERAKAAADAIAAQRAKVADRIARTCLGPPRAPLTGEAAIEQLAEDLRTAHARLGSVTRADMSLLGWQAAQLHLYEIPARERAYGMENAA